MILFRNIKKKLILIILLLSCGLAQAINVDFDNITQPENSLNVDVVISGLGSGASPSIPTYDININFDQNHLAFSSAVFGDQLLGNQLDLFDFGINEQSVSLSNPGALNIFELSFDTPNDLDALQANSFTLATLTFDVLQLSSSQLEFSTVILSDTGGNSLSAVTTDSTITTVPAPAALWLMVSGLSGLYIKRKSQIY